MKIQLVVVAALWAVASARIVPRSAGNTYKMCVPENLIDACIEMTKTETKSTAQILCIPARDRIECMEKLKEHEADFVVVDPEDMYIAKDIDHDHEELAIFEEIRTKEEPEAEFRYEGIALIHKDLDLPHGIKSLKGLRSCHTGVGRNVGFKIPITKLRKMGVMGKLNEPGLSARENEMKAWSQLFSKACIVGDWSLDPVINKHMKEKYSNLCALCEDPVKCDYPDKFSGYDGAIRCLAHNGGQIAWTKVIFVRKFFGLAVGTTPASTPQSDAKVDDYRYLCPDGTREPVTSTTPCRWAARPWQGYMVNAAEVKTIDDLRTKIENLNAIGSETHQTWLPKVLELSEKQVPVSNKIISPGHYLDKGNYTDVVEREYGPPVKVVRMCTSTTDAYEKCLKLRQAAFTRNIRPRLGCVQEHSIEDCMRVVRDHGAEVMKIDAGHVETARERYDLKPIMHEQYLKEKRADYYAVAVVKKNSNVQSLADLKGTKSCHSGYKTSAGYNAVIHQLLEQSLIKSDSCPYAKALSEFFSGSCVPGLSDFRHDLTKDVVTKLRSLCKGSEKQYSGYTGALRCLTEGRGDVAFLSHITVPANTDGKNHADWAKDLRSEDFQLLCPAGGRKNLAEYESCHLMKTPAHMVVTSKTRTEAEIEEIQDGLLPMADLYSKRPDLFRMFGDFNGTPDVLFKNAATGLKALHEDMPDPEGYRDAMTAIHACH